MVSTKHAVGHPPADSRLIEQGHCLHFCSVRSNKKNPPKPVFYNEHYLCLQDRRFQKEHTRDLFIFDHCNKKNLRNKFQTMNEDLLPVLSINSACLNCKFLFLNDLQFTEQLDYLNPRELYLNILTFCYFA